MAKRKQPPIPILRIKKGDSLKMIYRKARRAFTAADLQRYTEDEPMFPTAELVAELEAIDRADAAKSRKKARR